VEAALVLRPGAGIEVASRAAWAGAAMRRRRRADEFERFFLDNYESVLRSVTFVCGDRERAADATQDAFIRAADRWHRVGDYDNPAAWVRRIAINRTRDEHRSEQRRTERERVNGSAIGQAPPPELPTLWSGSVPLATLMSLPDRQRAIAALYFIDDLSIAEISDTLSIAEGTVRFHLSEARRRLRSALGTAEGVRNRVD
jgi:RNA polymerase sigma-70 factor (ECF subfamily)